MRGYSRLISIGLFSALAVGLFGCNGALSPASGVSAGTASASGGDANSAATADPLNPIVSGDRAEAFRNFVGTLRQERGHRDGPFALTDEERAQIEDLQAKLDAGELTPDQFADQIEAVLGDAAPNSAFGGLNFFGSPFGQRLRDAVASRLSLTDEQVQAGEQLFIDTHQKISHLVIAALAQMRLVLTQAQRDQLDALWAERFASIREDARPDPAALGRGGIRGRVQGFFEKLAGTLGLTQEQRDAIAAIRTQLRSDIKTAHHTARDAFLALLTDEQRATLDQLESEIRERFGGRHGRPDAPGTGN